MKSNTIQLVMSSTTMTGTNVLTSNPIPLDQIFQLAVQAAWTGTPVGNFKLQGSCDSPPNQNQISSPDNSVITNWTDITATQAAGGAAGNYMWNIPDVGYRYARLVYTNASSTGLITVAQACVKGA